MRIGLKLTAAFLGIASLVGAAGYLARGTNREVEHEMERLSRSAVVKADTAEIADALYTSHLAAHALAATARRGSSAVAATADESREVHGQIERSRQRIEQSLDRLRLTAESLIRGSADAWPGEAMDQEAARSLQSLQQLQQKSAEYQQLMHEFLLAAEEDAENAQQFLENRLCRHFQSELLPLLSAEREQARSEFTRGIRSTQRAIAVADQRRGMLTIAAAAGAVVLGLFMSRSIGKPLGLLQRAALEMGQGRLDTRVPVHSRDEVGVLAVALNQMAADLQERTVSRDHLDNIIRSMREMLIVTDTRLQIRYVNPATGDELGFVPDELVGRPLEDLFAREDLGPNAALVEILAPGLQCNMMSKSGDRIPVHCSLAEMSDAAGQFDGVVCVASNISRQKEAEAQILSALREKQLLLKEVHHRVKNNLQVISSLLSLQAQELRDPETIRLFQESQGRIRSMALIHEQLYRSDDLAEIEFAGYLEQLVAHLRHTFGNSAAEISIGLEVEPLPLPLDLAIPCGMMVNELICNAMEHAFPNCRSGEIHIGFHSDRSGYCLEVADNGVGMRTEPADTNASLGMKVVQALVRQLHGTLDVRQNGGTAFVLRFPGSQQRHPDSISSR
ncbi:MAG: HAMP domain-containing protein [Planctomycetaceae bacterium]|nr:HAMP domain-containing protein [Planctomycetaceae bacterium]